MPRLTYTTFDGVLHHHELQQGRTRVGRTADNDLRIDELEVSSHHCEIRRTGDVITVKDLDSVGGTYLEGEPLREREAQVGQVLSLGTFLVKVEESGEGAEGGSSASTEGLPAQLADGSFSCLRHRERRADFECPACFNLACAECAGWSDDTQEMVDLMCRSCGGKLCRIDWSGLTMGKAEALATLLPEPVQSALDFWAKRRGK